MCTRESLLGVKSEKNSDSTNALQLALWRTEKAEEWPALHFDLHCAVHDLVRVTKHNMKFNHIEHEKTVEHKITSCYLGNQSRRVSFFVQESPELGVFRN